MKVVHRIIPFVFAGLVAVSCSKKESTDTNEIAEEANEEKFDDQKEENDADFVAETVAANYAEISLAKLAAQKSDNTQIKEVAQLLEKEHGKLLEEFQTFASLKAITVPSEEEDKAKRKIEDLTNEEDVKEFNREWCKAMVDRHEKNIREFESRLEKTQDADLKILIDQKLPDLRTHLDKIKACEQSI
jgi:putative membrane protein